MPMTPEDIKSLWIQAGGNPQHAGTAAAVALAESSGNPQASHTNSSGSVDRGLWQINSIHGALSSFDPLANARAAVAISKNGATWEPWCAAYTDRACGKNGGRYDPFNGSGSAQFIGVTGASPAQGGGAPGAGGPVGDLPSAGGAGYGGMIDAVVGNFFLTVDIVLNNTFYAALALAGIASLVIGVIMLSKETPVGAAISAVKRFI